MKFRTWSVCIVLSVAAGLTLSGVGCGPGSNKVPVAEKDKGHDHGGWWCDEHGIPEEICGQCNARYAAACKAKGDWCDKHDRPDSQCFLCHPELKEKFAAQYRAKYGKEPPPIEDETPREEKSN